MEFLARNSWNLNTSCAGALLWWRIQLSGQSSGFSSEQIPVTLSALPNNAVDLPFVLVQWLHSELSLCDWRNTQAWSWPATKTCAFLGRGECCVLHYMLCRFVSRSFWKHHVSSPVMTLLDISALRKRSDEMWSRHCFWSCVKIQGTIFSEIFLIPKSSFTICHTVSLFIFNSSAITLTPNLRSECTKVRTLCTFTSVLCVFGCPLLVSSCTSSRPSLNHLCHSKTLDFFIVYSP